MNKILKCIIFIFLILFVSIHTSCTIVDDTNNDDQQQEENNNNNNQEDNNNQNDNHQDVDGLPWV